MHIKILCCNTSMVWQNVFTTIKLSKGPPRKDYLLYFQRFCNSGNSKIYFQGFECVEIVLTPVLRGLVLVPVEYFGLDEDSEDNADIDEDDLINNKVIFVGKAILN